MWCVCVYMCLFQIPLGMFLRRIGKIGWCLTKLSQIWKGDVFSETQCTASLFIFMFLVYFLLFVLSLFVSTSASDCLERLVSEVTCMCWHKTLLTHSLSLTHSPKCVVRALHVQKVGKRSTNTRQWTTPVCGVCSSDSGEERRNVVQWGCWSAGEEDVLWHWQSTGQYY